MMTKIIIILLLLANNIYSQNITNTVEHSCIIPLEDNMPIFIGGCDSLDRYFNNYFEYDNIIQHLHLPYAFSIAECIMDSTGQFLDIIIYSKNTIYNERITESLTNMGKWDVSKLKTNEFYSMIILFRFNREFNLDVKFTWKISNFK
jgi:hypothetical protein